MGIHRNFSGQLTRAAATASGTQAVTGVGGKPKMVWFSGVDDADVNNYSDGWDDGSTAGCNFVNHVAPMGPLLSVGTKSSTLSINVQTSGGDGHTGVIQSMDVDGFTVSWTKVGAGRNVTVKYLAIL